MKKILYIFFIVVFILTNISYETYASYDLTENEVKIAKAFIEDGISLYESGIIDEAIYSFSQVLLIDPHNLKAKQFLSDISKHKGINVKQKIKLLKLEDLYSNINSLKSRINYFEEMRNMLGRKLVNNGYSSSDLAYNMVEIKNKAVKSFNSTSIKANKAFDNSNPLEVLNSALQYEKDQLSLKSYYLNQQYESMKKLEPNKTGSNCKFVKSKYKQSKYKNRFYTQTGERIVHNNRYNSDINLSNFKYDSNNIRQMKRHIALIRREMNTLKESIDSKEIKINDLTGQLVDSTLRETEKSKNLKTAIKNLSDQNNKVIDLSSRLELSHRIMSDKDEEINSLKSSFENIKRDALSFESNLKDLMTAKNQKLKGLEISLENNKQQLALSKEKNVFGEEKISTLKDKINILNFKINRSENELVDKDIKLNTLKEKLSFLESKIKKDNDINAKKVSSFKEEILSLLDKLNARNKELKSNQVSLEKLKIRFNKQYSKLSKKNEEIKKINKECRATKSLAKKLSKEKNLIESRLAKKIKELNISEQNIDNKNNIILSKTDIIKLKNSVIKGLNKEKMQLVKSITVFERELKEKTEEIDKAYNDLFKKTAALSKSKDEKNRISKLLKKYQKDLKTREKSISEVTKDLAKKEEIIKKDKTDIDGLKKELLEVQMSLNEEVRTRKKLIKELAVLKKELDAKEQVVTEQNLEIDSLQKVFTSAKNEIKNMTPKKEFFKDANIKLHTLGAKDKKIASLKRDLKNLEDMFNSTKLIVRKQKLEILALKKTFENYKLSENIITKKVSTPSNIECEGSSTDRIINDLISLNSEIIRLQGTYTNTNNKYALNNNLQIKSIMAVLSQAKRITRIMEDKANNYIMINGSQKNELKGILEIYKDKLNVTTESLRKSEITVSILNDQIAFAQKQLFEKNKLLNKTQNDLLTLEEELLNVKEQIKTLKNPSK